MTQNRKQQRIARQAMLSFGYTYAQALRLVREGKIKLDKDDSIMRMAD